MFKAGHTVRCRAGQTQGCAGQGTTWQKGCLVHMRVGILKCSILRLFGHLENMDKNEITSRVHKSEVDAMGVRLLATEMPFIHITGLEPSLHECLFLFLTLHLSIAEMVYAITPHRKVLTGKGKKIGPLLSFACTK